MFLNELKNLNLTGKEALLYETLLLLGPSPISTIVKKSRLKKGDVYNILKSLKEKKLINSEQKSKKTFFLANQPAHLRDIWQEKKQQLDNQERILNGILPGLTSLFQTTTEKPIISIFRDLPGLASVYEDILKSKNKEILIFVSKYDRTSPEMEDLIEKQSRKQVRLNFKVRALNPWRDEKFKLSTKEYLQERKKINASVRFLPSSCITPSQIIIYDNKVAITSLKKELITTLIENDNISATMKIIF